MLSLLGAIQSIILGQALTQGELKAGKSNSLPPVARTLEHWEWLGKRLGILLGGGISNLCKRITQL